MRLARMAIDGRVVLARLEDGKAVIVALESDHPAADVMREALAGGVDLAGAGEVVEAGEGRLLAPVARPSKVLAIGLNYADHAREAGAEAPPAPLVFAITPNAVAGPDDPIRLTAGASTQVDYEAELGVVIGRVARDVEEGDALDHVLGYTAVNDVTARDAQFGDGQWTRGKSLDTFAPMGPCIVTPDEVGDVQRLAVRCRVNGETVQDGTTADMIFGVAHIVAYLSRFWTLLPGDVIATGTPAGVGFARNPPVFLQPGDLVEVDIEGVGVLANPVEAPAAT